MPPRTNPRVGRSVQICMPQSNDYIRDIVMPPLRGSMPQDPNLSKLEYVWTALDKLESRMDANDRRLEQLRPPQRPDPEPPYDFRNGGGTDWNRSHRRYSQSPYRQPQDRKPDRYLSQPPYLTDRPVRRSSCWDKPRARAPMSSLTYEVSESTYYSNNDWDFDDYEESASDSDGDNFDVGYSRQPYHQLHSMTPQRPPYFTRDSYVQTQSSNPHSHRRTTHSNGQPWHKDRPLLPRSTSCCQPTTQLRQAAAGLEQPAAEQQPLFQHLPSCQHPLSGTIKEDKDFQGNVKRVDVEGCCETELIPSHHSSSLDQELDAHHKMEKNSFNRMGSFLDKVDVSKSSLLDDKATFDDDELIEMEHQSVKVSDDVDLNFEREGDSSSSPSCVDNSLQQKCWGSDDEDDVDGVDVSPQQHNLVQPMMMELESCEIGCLPTISEDSVTPKMIENLRPRKIDHTIRFKYVMDGIQRFYKSYTKEIRKQDILNYRASHAAICFLQLKETKPFTAGKTRADSVLPRFLAGKGRRDLEVVYVVAFDPGRKVLMLLICYNQLCPLFRGSHLEDKVDFNEGGVDTSL